MPYLSNLQQLLTGLALGYSGYSLVFQHEAYLARLAPLLQLVDSAVTPESLRIDQHAASFLPLFGIGILALSYFYLMGAYTRDEKFKRNSVPGRFILAFLSYYTTTLESQSSTSIIPTLLIKLFGIFNLVTGLWMGLSIGFEDGNKVDMDEEVKRKRREAFLEIKWKAREQELLDKLKVFEEKGSASKGI